MPFACQDWANTKAVYRFLSNGKGTGVARQLSWPAKLIPAEQTVDNILASQYEISLKDA
ncbi:hypothetical protein FQ179_14115 [Pusillimonas sp. ANT_WB101]|nr:hypothetical protein FQ179_14115 [Pusillimonas sp. ANT_WB101]